MPPVRLEPTTNLSRVKHSTTELPHSSKGRGRIVWVGEGLRVYSDMFLTILDSKISISSFVLDFR